MRDRCLRFVLVLEDITNKVSKLIKLHVFLHAYVRKCVFVRVCMHDWFSFNLHIPWILALLLIDAYWTLKVNKHTGEKKKKRTTYDIHYFCREKKAK